ncbi:MAG: hypothetical protein JNM12_10100 [Alphaproteobacteria bacterium]|nr:hypothetical protein [Alphaproteobacteria bacterium]
MVNRTGQSYNIPQADRRQQESAAPLAASYATTAPGNISSMAEPAKMLANSLQAQSRRIEERLDRIAVDEGEAQGMMQAAEGDVPVRRDGTMRGAAYDQAAMRTMLARHDIDARRNAEELFLKHKENPAALAKGLDGYMQGVLQSSLDGQLKAQFKINFSEISNAYLSEAKRHAEARAHAAAAAAFTDARDGRLKSIQDIALFEQDDEKASTSLASQIADLGKFAIEQGKTPAEAKRLTEQATELARNYRWRGKFLQADSPVGQYGPQIPIQAQRRVMKAFDEEFKSGNSGLSLEAYDALGSKMRADLNRAEAQHNGALSLIGKGISSAQRLIEDGYNPGQDQLEALQAQAAQTGDPAAVAATGQVKALWEFQDAARTLRPDQLQGWINGEQARLQKSGNVSEFEAGRAEMAEKLLTSMNTELQRDPLSWASRVGIVQPAPLDFGNPQSFAKRQTDAETVAQHYGVTPPLMTNEEVAQWSSQWNQSTPDQKLGMVTALQAGFGADAVHAYEAIAKDAPGLANVGGLLSQAPAAHMQTARDFTVGDTLLAGKDKTLPASNLLQERASEVLGDVYGYAPGAHDAVLETAKRLYAARASRAGLTPADFDEKIYDRALREASGAWYDKQGKQYGGVTEQRRGHYVVLPANTTEDQFADMLDKITDADLAALSVGGATPRYSTGRVMTADELRSAYLISSGPGRYLVSETNPKAAAVFVQGSNATGHFEIDLAKLKELKK